jgi:subtilisin family serine protease
VPGELLVLPGGLAPQSLAARVQGVEVQRALEGGFLQVKVPPGQEKAKAKALLQAGARWVQPNYLYQPLASPNDPSYFPRQRSQLNGLLGLESAWNSEKGDPNLIVSVVDTGYLTHIDASSRWYLPPDETLDLADNDSDPVDDTPAAKGSFPFSHGLAVASVIGADTNNDQGMAGVTWFGQLLPLKVARSSDGQIPTAVVASAVRKAADLGAKVINLSLGVFLGEVGFDAVLENALAYARGEGATLVAAVGNNGVDGVLYPASSPRVIAVGAVDNDRRKASFSNCGPEVDLVAPGVGVVVLAPNNALAQANGTSFAAPMVSGVVALYMSRYQRLYGTYPTPDQVYQCLVQTAEDLGLSGRDTGYGFGLVRADRVMTDTTYCFP